MSDVLRVFIEKGIRNDGRSLEAHRGVTLKSAMYTGTDLYGSSQVHIGKTIVTTGVNLMIGTTSDTCPDKGDIGSYPCTVAASASESSPPLSISISLKTKINLNSMQCHNVTYVFFEV